jgi:hypothetical protein
MVINRDYVKVRLQKIECKYRGYYGTDIAEIAKELNVTSFGLKKQISKWAKVDSSFAGFTCLGKHRPSITLDEFIEIKDRIQSNPLEFWTDAEKSNFMREPSFSQRYKPGKLGHRKAQSNR